MTALGLLPLVQGKTLMMTMSFVWKETPLQASRIHVIFDNLDDIMTQNYAEEKAEIRRRIKREVVQLRAGVPGNTRSDEVDQQMTG